MSITENLLHIKSQIPKDVTLVAVSKTKPVVNLMEAYQAGQRIFGENKVQEMSEKFQNMPKDIQWHLIGHLQTNKVKFIAPFVSLIHSVDSLKLLQEIDKQAQKNNRIIDCLLQIYIATEETKFGLNQIELENLINTEIFKNLNNINITGFMGMASFSKNINLIRKEFLFLKGLYDKYSIMDSNYSILSMGMSGDFKLAIECGSNMIRIGSTIFNNNDKY